MESCERNQRVAQQACAAQRGPGNRALVCSCLRAVSFQGLTSTIEAQDNAGGGVCKEREGDKQGFGECGLVVGACKKEVAIGLGNGAGGKGNEGGICYVERSEESKCVGRVFLDAYDWWGW